MLTKKLYQKVLGSLNFLAPFIKEGLHSPALLSDDSFYTKLQTFSFSANASKPTPTSPLVVPTREPTETNCKGTLDPTGKVATHKHIRVHSHREMPTTPTSYDRREIA